MIRVSASQKRVLEFIRSEIAAGRPFPKALKIAEHMGWKNATGANDVLTALVCNGFVRIKSREPKGRGWKYEWELVA